MLIRICPPRRLAAFLTIASGCVAREPIPTSGDNDPTVTPDTGTAGSPEQPCPESDTPLVDPIQCHVFCGAVDVAGCLEAPAHDQCVEICESALRTCPARVRALWRCFDGQPAFECNEDHTVTSRQCERELECVQICAAGG